MRSLVPLLDPWSTEERSQFYPDSSSNVIENMWHYQGHWPKDRCLGILSKRWRLTSGLSYWNRKHLLHFPKFGIEWRSVNFISEGKLINILGFVGHNKISVTTTPLSHINIKAANIQYTHECADCVLIKLSLQKQRRTGKNRLMSHSLPTLGLKESSNLCLKDLDKPYYSQLGRLRLSEGSHLPRVKEQVDIFLYILLLASSVFFGRSKKWMIKEMESEAALKPASQSSFMFGGATVKAR